MSDLVLPQQPNTVALRTNHDFFVALDPAQDGMLIGNAEESAAERFTLLHLSNGKIALLASTGNYVTAVHRGRWALLANARALGEAQQFDMQRLDDGRVSFRTAYHRNVTAMDDQPGWHWELRAETSQIQDWEKFTLVPVTVAPSPPWPKEKWLDCEVRVHDRSASGYKTEMTFNGEQTIGGWLSSDAASFVPSGDPRDDGQRLFDLLFADPDLREAWGEARGQARQRRMRLRIDPPELRGLSWELLRDEADIFAAQADTPFSRYLATEKPWGGAIADRPIRILTVISNPSDLADKHNLPSVDVKSETTTLRAAIGQGASLDFMASPITLARLEEELQKGYHALHFIGHGAFNAKKQQAALYLQNDDGTSNRVSDDDFAGMLNRLSSRMPQLIVLAACQSAMQAPPAQPQAFSGLGPKLVQIGIPAVVAMQDDITILTARQFGAKFYRRLLEHGTVDLAMNEARSALITNERFDAAVPVLFMRLRDGRLWQAAVPLGGAPQAAVPPNEPPQPIGRERLSKEDRESLERQLQSTQENLRLIEERKADYVQETDVPLQLIKEERRLRAKIAELETKLRGSA